MTLSKFISKERGNEKESSSRIKICAASLIGYGPRKRNGALLQFLILNFGIIAPKIKYHLSLIFKSDIYIIFSLKILLFLTYYN